MKDYAVFLQCTPHPSGKDRKGDVIYAANLVWVTTIQAYSGSHALDLAKELGYRHPLVQQFGGSHAH